MARKIISIVLVVLTGLLVPAAVTAAWAERTVLDTDQFTDTVSEVTSNPEVIDAVATRITTEVMTAILSSDFVQNLPPPLRTAVGVVAGAMRSRVQEGVENVLASDAGQDALKFAVAEAHKIALRILEGEGLLSTGALTVENGTATLNLRPLILQVLQRLQADGVLPASWQIPAPTDPPGQLATAIGARLPENFGEIVVYQTDNVSQEGTLDAAQRGLVLLKRGLWVLIILALACAIGAVLVAVDRRRAIFHVGLAIAIGGLLFIVAIRRVVRRLPSAATTPGGKAVADALGDALGSSLISVLALMVAAAVIVALVARFLTPILGWAGTHTEIATVVAVALGIVVLLVLGTGWGAIITALVVVGLGIFGVQYAKRRAVSAGGAATA